MSDLARLPSYPSPTTLIARSGIQFLDFGFDPARLRVREWGFHDAAATKSVDDLVQLEFDEARGQYEVIEAGRRRAAHVLLHMGFLHVTIVGGRLDEFGEVGRLAERLDRDARQRRDDAAPGLA